MLLAVESTFEPPVNVLEPALARSIQPTGSDPHVHETREPKRLQSSPFLFDHSPYACHGQISLRSTPAPFVTPCCQNLISSGIPIGIWIMETRALIANNGNACTQCARGRRLGTTRKHVHVGCNGVQVYRALLYDFLPLSVCSGPQQILPCVTPKTKPKF